MAEAQQQLARQSTISRSKAFLLNPERGLWLPEAYGFEADAAQDRHGRPRRVNQSTVSDFYSLDILAADRFFQPESNRVFPPFAHQRVMMREFILRQFLYVQIMRGGAKSSTFARILLNYALMVPGTPEVLVAPTFRQSLLVFDEIVRLIELNKNNHSSAFNISNELVGEVRRGTMEAAIRFRNGSKIVAVPMGDGQKIRGLRGGVLFVDEAYQIDEEMYESHLRPFVGVKQGGRDSKIVMTSTSWFQDCFMYKRLMHIASEVKVGNPLYGILDFTLDDLVSTGFPLSEAIWKDAHRHGNPLTYAMTYFNIWPDSQGRWYEQSAIDAAISSRHGVRIELQRAPETAATYFAIVDLAASEKGDSSCILVAKYEDGVAKYVYGKAGKGWSNHRRAWETHQVIDKFDPRFVIYDAHGAIGKDFRTDMALDTLIVVNEEDKTEMKTVTPVIHYDDNRKRGARILIPMRPNEEAVIHALTGERQGFLDGEDGMNALLHTKTRTLLSEGKMVGPGIDVLPSLDDEVAAKTLYAGSEQNALDIVREAFQQLGKISLDKDLEGNQKMTKSGQLVFKKKSGVSVDDGAFCLIYGAVGVLRLLGNNNDQPHTKPRTVAMTLGQQMPKENERDAAFVQKLTFI